MTTATCGVCGRAVVMADQQNVAICLCKAAISRPGTPLTEIIDAMMRAGVQPSYTEQMREWGAGNGVTPLQPRDTSRDSRLAFGRASDDADRREFYAGWRAYDEALERMPERQRILQQRAEVLELERQFAL